MMKAFLPLMAGRNGTHQRSDLWPWRGVLNNPTQTLAEPESPHTNDLALAAHRPEPESTSRWNRPSEWPRVFKYPVKVARLSPLAARPLDAINQLDGSKQRADWDVIWIIQKATVAIQGFRNDLQPSVDGQQPTILSPFVAILDRLVTLDDQTGPRLPHRQCLCPSRDTSARRHVRESYS